jgi:hypothetical protein
MSRFALPLIFQGPTASADQGATIAFAETTG